MLKKNSASYVFSAVFQALSNDANNRPSLDLGAPYESSYCASVNMNDVSIILDSKYVNILLSTPTVGSNTSVSIYP